MHTRRQLLQRSATLAGLLGGLGLLPDAAQAAWNSAAFEAKSVAEVLKALGAAAPTLSSAVSVSGPDIAENGAVVPVGCATTLAGVKRLMILVEKNPNTLSAIFELSDAVEPSFSTRVKMGQSSNVMVVAVTADDKLLYAQKEIKITLGGCGG